jgi:hypothetical protein
MKLIIKLLTLLSYTVYFSLSLRFKRTGAKEDFSTAWTALFKTTVRPPQQCNPPDNFIRPQAPPDGDQDLKIPKKKDNPFAKLQGFGDSAYLWDYLDGVLQTTIMTELKTMYDDALKLVAPDEKVFPDPYSLQKLIFYYSQGKEDTSNFDQAKLLTTIAAYNKNFIADVWQKSISVPQVYQIFETWGWYKLPVNDNPRKSVNYFDFNGDGRLSPYEFIIFAVVNNKNVFRNSNCKTHCFAEICSTKLDPLFAFVDCDADGWINAENMWLGLENVNRPAEGWNIYNCVLPNSVNSLVRTTAMNDFILKNFKKANGYVNLDEWRRGFILGYNDRNCDDSTIFMDDTRNKKTERWNTDGTTDTQCEKIKKMMPSTDASGDTLNQGTAGIANTQNGVTQTDTTTTTAVATTTTTVRRFK